jgi:hypothetical protein
MDVGEIIYISSQLIAGAFASFFAIMLWSKTRDVAWMLIVIGAISAYVNTVYSILEYFGIVDDAIFSIGSVPFASIVLPILPPIFFSIAFVVMVIRKTRKQ